MTTRFTRQTLLTRKTEAALSASDRRALARMRADGENELASALAAEVSGKGLPLVRLGQGEYTSDIGGGR